jgi:hypothetical protein
MSQCSCGSKAINDDPTKELCDCCWRDETIRRLNAQLDIASEILTKDFWLHNPKEDWCPDFRTVLAAMLDAKEGRCQTLAEVIAELNGRVSTEQPPA